MSARYWLICLCLKDLTASATVILLAIMAMVENQNTFGNPTDFQLTWWLFTMKALVKPANIITILPIATHRVNLWGCIFFLCFVPTILTLISFINIPAPFHLKGVSEASCFVFHALLLSVPLRLEPVQIQQDL